MDMHNTIKAATFTLLSSVILMASAQAITISKNSGATTPYNPDFSAGHLSYLYMSSGYNDPNYNRMFLETFEIRKCRVKSAKFKIELKRIGEIYNNDAFHLMSNNGSSNGSAYYSVAPIWTSNASTRTILHSLSPSELSHISSTGRFSFLVQDDTSVDSATLIYSCAKPTVHPIKDIKLMPKIKAVKVSPPMNTNAIKIDPPVDILLGKSKPWDLQTNPMNTNAIKIDPPVDILSGKSKPWNLQTNPMNTNAIKVDPPVDILPGQRQSWDLEKNEQK